MQIADGTVVNSSPQTVLRACICFDFAKFSANVFSHAVFRFAPDSLLPQTTVSYHNFLGTSNPTSMFFYPTTAFELSRLISETPSKFSAGWDGIFIFLF